jgi:hypothetical protein
MKGGLRKRPGSVPKGIWTGLLCQGFRVEPMESLLEELPAKRNGMATEAPSRIVLDLTRLHGTSLRKVCRQTKGWETSTKGEGRWAVCKISDRAVEIAPLLDFFTLRTACFFGTCFALDFGRTEN